MDRRKLLVRASSLIVLALVLLIAGCKTAASTPAPQTVPTPTPEVFIPRTAVVSDGATISGRVLWGGGPVAGVTVELRAGAWADPATSEVIAQAVSDHSGVYELEAPPEGGVFGLVAVWPDGADNLAPATSVRVMPGDTQVEADVFLDRPLETPTPALDADGVPATCRVDGLSTYADTANGFCFAYPTTFEATVNEAGNPLVVGPPLDSSVEPLRASLLVEVEVAAQDKTLTEIVDGYVAQFADLDVPAIERTPIELAGQPAELLEGVPGREGSRDIFMVREGTLFHLMFMPSVRDFPQAASDVQLLATTVVATFSVMSPTAVGPSGQSMPPVSDDLAFARIVIAEAGLSTEIPAGWLRPGPAWDWIPSENSAVHLGITWADLTPPQEAEAVLLPQPAQILDSEEITLTWGSGRLFTVEVYAPASEGKAAATRRSVEMHAIVVVAQGGVRRAFDLYATAPDETALGAQEALLLQMLDSSAR
jgi:hypothetical protein